MKEICSLCHQETTPIEIYGHTQCSKCGQNYLPCCEGEQATAIYDPASQTDPVIHRPDRSGDLTRCYE